MREDWITSDQMRTELDSAGVSISASRLERWRREKLLPGAKQIGLGRGRGSVAMVPPDSARQALEIDRLYKVREKRDWVGWQLWMQGYWVGDQYWRAPMERARVTIRDVARQARRYGRLSESEDGDLAALQVQARSLARGTPFAAPLASIEAPIFETLLGVGNRIIMGEFDRFNWDAGEADMDRSAVINLFGAANAERHSIDGIKLGFASPIEGVLQEISAAFGRLARRRSISEPPYAVRRELAQAFEVGTGLYDMLSPILGRSAMGLRTTNWIGLNPDISVHSAILLVWSELRQFSALLRPQIEIAKLHGEAAKARELADKFWSALSKASSDEQARIFAELKRTISIPKRVNSFRELHRKTGN